MSIELWLAFVLTATIVVLIPGPTVILVIGHSLAHGRRSTLPLVTGVALGDFTAMSASLLGLGAIMAASAALFTAFKFIGAAYLIYMGISMWRAQPAAVSADPHSLHSAGDAEQGTEMKPRSKVHSSGSLFRNAENAKSSLVHAPPGSCKKYTAGCREPLTKAGTGPSRTALITRQQ